MAWDAFNAKTISVNGNVRVSKETVIDHSKLKIGQNILGMNLSVAKKRLRSHPMIADVTIGRNFPSGVTIGVKEHRPIAILDLGRTFAVNSNGDIFIEVPVSEINTVPVITGFSPSDINADGKIDTMPFEEVMTLLRLGRNSNSVFSTMGIRRIDVDKQTGIIVRTSGRIQSIGLGYGNYLHKIDRLKTIVSFLEKRPDLKKFMSIDLNNVKRIVLKPSRTG